VLPASIVRDVAPAVAPQQLPATGSPATLLAAIGAALTVAGILLVVRFRLES